MDCEEKKIKNLTDVIYGKIVAFDSFLNGFPFQSLMVLSNLICLRIFLQNFFDALPKKDPDLSLLFALKNDCVFT